MDHLEIPMGEVRRRKRLCFSVYEGLFEDSEQNSRAENIISSRVESEHTISGSGQSNTAVVSDVQNTGGVFSNLQLARGVSGAWTDASKYSGDPEDIIHGTSFATFKNGYLMTMSELDVPREMRVKFMHHALKGPAKVFFFSDIFEKIHFPAEAFTAIENRFLDESTKLSLRSKLMGLRLSEVQEEFELSKLAALEKVREMIYTLSQNGHNEYKSDTSMIDILEKQVLRSELWSSDIATRRATQQFTFSSYCSALTSWLRTAIEKGDTRFGNLQRPPTGSHNSGLGVSIALVHYGEQFRTGRGQGPKKVRQPVRKTIKPRCTCSSAKGKLSPLWPVRPLDV